MGEEPPTSRTANSNVLRPACAQYVLVTEGNMNECSKVKRDKRQQMKSDGISCGVWKSCASAVVPILDGKKQHAFIIRLTYALVFNTLIIINF